MTIPTGVSVPQGIFFLEEFTEAEPIDQLRLYDQALKGWTLTFLHPLITDKNGMSRSFDTIFATPERAFAEQRDLLNRQMPEYKRRRDPIARPDYPTCSITRLGKSLDFGRRRHRGIIRKAGFTNKDIKDEYYQFPYPSAWDISYQIEFFALNRSILNHIESWLMLQFDDDKFYITVSFRQINPTAYACPYVVPVEILSLDDNSDLEVGGGDRIVRATLSLTVKAWIFRPLRRIKTANKLTVDVCVPSRDDSGNIETDGEGEIIVEENIASYEIDIESE